MLKNVLEFSGSQLSKKVEDITYIDIYMCSILVDLYIQE